MLANHPARKGIDSPHEIRAWRDATSRGHQIAVGFEGAPGHQAGGLPEPSARAAPAASTTAARAPTPSPATPWRATAPGAASTG